MAAAQRRTQKRLLVALLGAAGAAAVSPAASGEPLCFAPGLWGTAGCLAGKTAVLGQDLASHGVGSLGEGPRTAWSTFVARMPVSRQEAASVVQPAVSAVCQLAGTAGSWGAEALRGVAHSSAPDAVRTSLSATGRWRDAFVQAFPAHSRHFADELAFASTAAWLALVAYVLWRGVRWVWSLLRPAKKTEVMFFPDRSGRNVGRIVQDIRRARRRVWVAMFTLTEDRLSTEVMHAFHRGIDVRVMVDDDQSLVPGSDVQRLAEAGVPILLDESPARMHHKFAVVDQTLLTGSFNWTKMASTQNCENLMIIYEKAVVKAFAGEFQRLWALFSQRGRPLGRSGLNCRRPRAASPGLRRLNNAGA